MTTEQHIKVRKVTAWQPNWTENAPGEPGNYVFQLILDQGAEEYVLRLTEGDADKPLRLAQRERRGLLRHGAQGPHLRRARARLMPSLTTGQKSLSVILTVALAAPLTACGTQEAETKARDTAAQAEKRAGEAADKAKNAGREAREEAN